MNWQPSPPFKAFLLCCLIAAAIMAAVKAEAAEYQVEKITTLTTGETHDIRWCNPTGQQTSDWTVRVQIMEFPPVTGALPSWEHVTPASTATTWSWTPTRAGAYYARAQSCSEADGCSVWATTVETQTGEACSTTPERLVYFVKLAPPTSGGIE